MLAEGVDYVIGVDTHRDQHVLAVMVAQTGAVVAQQSVRSDSRGYREALRVVDEYAAGARLWAVEGAGPELDRQRERRQRRDAAQTNEPPLDEAINELPVFARAAGETLDILFEIPGSPFLFIQYAAGVQVELPCRPHIGEPRRRRTGGRLVRSRWAPT
jgi:hypothetical protein